MKNLFCFVFILSFLGCRAVSENPSQLLDASCGHAIVFFDLGDTIVDTKTFADPVTHDFKRIFYYKETKNYLETLKDDGHELGMLIDVPETWGATHAEKMKKLKDFISVRWKDDNNPSFVWEDFRDDFILLPPRNTDRKDQSDYLFKAAKKIADDRKCPSIFQGEQKTEVKQANDIGMNGFLIQYDNDKQPIYMKPEAINQIVSRQP